jgi:hypothetical protein
MRRPELGSYHGREALGIMREGEDGRHAAHEGGG